MTAQSLEKLLSANKYPGRGIVIGRSGDGRRAVAAYFIMGRSENSRNRIFVEDGEGIRTQAFEPEKLQDSSLIIYAPVRTLGTRTIVTNGDQTDTICEGLSRNLTFEQSLRKREFEPDAPNYTPRISGILNVEGGAFGFSLSILKSDGGNPKSCQRFTFDYENPPEGTGRLLHTYCGDGTPLPSFEGEPVPVEISGAPIDEFAGNLWNALDEDNKISLFVRYIDIATGAFESRILNKNK